MIVGFNHNVLYLGVGFHVQTEDGGLKSPSLVTLLYHGGIIVSSQKTSYADILAVDNLNQVVEDLAKEQHKGMLRRLTKGEFDQRIRELGIAIEGGQPPLEKAAPKEAPEETPAEALAPEPETAAAEDADIDEDDDIPWLGDEIDELETVPLGIPVVEPDPQPDPASVEPPAPLPEPVAKLSEDDLPGAIQPAYEPPSAEDRDMRQDVSEALDDLIYSYLTGGDENS